MRSKFMIGLVILAVLGGLYAAALARKPACAAYYEADLGAERYACRGLDGFSR